MMIRLRTRSDAADRRADDGFVLLESIITISLITVIMSALAMFFIQSISITDQQRLRQSAAQVADTASESLHGMGVGEAYSGHTGNLVNAQFAAAVAQVQPWLTDINPAIDSTAGATIYVPTTGTTQTLNNVVYTVNTYLGWCYVPTSGSTDCVRTNPGSSWTYLRAIIAVTWPERHCPSSTCAYVTTTMLNADPDPVFNINQTPPPVPIVNTPATETFAVGDTVNLQLNVQNGTGVPTFQWFMANGSPDLPHGLLLSSDGKITGKPDTQVTNLTVTVQVFDNFNRSATATITWTILPPLTTSNPGAQSGMVGTPLTTPLSITASGGAGAPYSWSDPSATLPPGLSLATVSNKASITGTPTAPGAYWVKLTVTDASTTRTTAVSFNWTVSPGDQVSTLGNAITGLQLKASGGSGNYVWSDQPTSLPSGLSVSSSGSVTGTPTVLNTSGATVKLTATDTTTAATQTISFKWKVVAPPTIAAPIAQSNTETETPSVPVNYTCPNTTCVIALSGSVPGLGLSTSATNNAANSTTSLTVSSTTGTIYINGKIAPSAVTSGNSATFTPALQIMDSGNAVVSSGSWNWTVYSIPSIDALTTNRVTVGKTPSTTLAYNCPRSACTITLVGTMVTGLGLSATTPNTANNNTTSVTVSQGAGTVYVNGLVSTTAVSGTTGARAYSGLSVSITDNAAPSVTTTTTPTTWYAFGASYAAPTLTLPGNPSTKRGKAGTASFNYACANKNCVVTASGLPAGLGFNGTASTSLSLGTTTSGSFNISGTVSNAAAPGNYPVTLTITDGNGYLVTYSTFSWTVT